MSSGSDVDPTVYVEGLAGDVVAVLDQEAHRTGYLVRPAEAAERDRLQKLLLLLLRDASDHVRLYEPRADRVHRYAVAGKLLGGRFGEAEQAGLGRRVVGLANVARLTHEGAHVDDFASTLLHQVRQRGVHGVESAVQVHLDDLIPVLHRELPEGTVHVYAGVVDQYVYPVELVYRPVYEAFGLFGI